MLWDESLEIVDVGDEAPTFSEFPREGRGRFDPQNRGLMCLRPHKTIRCNTLSRVTQVLHIGHGAPLEENISADLRFLGPLALHKHTARFPPEEKVVNGHANYVSTVLTTKL